MSQSKKSTIDQLFSTIEQSVHKKLEEISNKSGTGGRKHSKSIATGRASTPKKITRKNATRSNVLTSSKHEPGRQVAMRKTYHSSKKSSSKKKRNEPKQKSNGNTIVGSKIANYSNPSEYKAQLSNNKKDQAKKRLARSEQTQKRKLKLELDRREKLQKKSGTARRQRLKQRSTEEKQRAFKLRQWLSSIEFGLRVQVMVNTVMQFRAFQSHLLLQDLSARIITRQLRIYKFKCYRKRVRAAIFVLGSIFVLKVKLWKRSRRRIASDKLRAFLVALDDENKRTNGCLAKVIIKGKKWRAYRLKIIVLQRLWRDHMTTLSAQVQLIDLQWQREQSRRTETYVTNKHKESMQIVTMENEKIDNVNRTRRLIKLKPLPRHMHYSFNSTKGVVLKGTDILSINHIVPAEIRVGIIRDVLRRLRRYHLARTEEFSKAVDEYKKEMLHIQRQRAILISFSGSQIANTWVTAQHNERRLAESVSRKEPQKPRFRLILQNKTLELLILTGENVVATTRKSWKSNNMAIPHMNFDGKLAADVHLKYERESERLFDLPNQT